MYGRRSSPYSRIEEVERGRIDLVVLIATAIVLAVLVNLSTNVVYDLVILAVEKQWLTLNAAPSQIWLRLLLALLCTGPLIVTVAVLPFVLGRQKAMVQIDVVAPYRLQGKKNITLHPQDSFRPPYGPVKHLQRMWNKRWNADRTGMAELAKKWQAAIDQRRPVQSELADEHMMLMEGLILQTLHRYTEESLEPGLQFQSAWNVEMDTQRLAFEDLPKVWQDNPYIFQNLGKDLASWKLLLPSKIEISTHDQGERRSLVLAHPYGKVTISYFRRPRVSKLTTQVGQVLSDGNAKDLTWLNFNCLGTRVEITAQFRLTMIPASDRFHFWASGLLANLEEAMDWRFFLDARTRNIVSDLTWKIGDLPREQSLWSALAELEKQMARLAKQLEAESEVKDSDHDSA